MFSFLHALCHCVTARSDWTPLQGTLVSGFLATQFPLSVNQVIISFLAQNQVCIGHICINPTEMSFYNETYILKNSDSECSITATAGESGIPDEPRPVFCYPSMKRPVLRNSHIILKTVWRSCWRRFVSCSLEEVICEFACLCFCFVISNSQKILHSLAIDLF